MSRSHVQGPEPVDVGPADHLPGRLSALTELWPQQPVVATPEGSGWRSMTRSKVTERARAAAAGLVARGIGPGDRVVLMGPPRAEWLIADLAVLYAGAVTVPLYTTAPPGHCRRILDDVGAAWAFAATAELADRLEAAGAEDVFVMDDGGLDELADDGYCDGRSPGRLEQRLAGLSLEDVATIVYTSGTTGRPKGCVLTHGNIAWTIRQTGIHLGEAIGPGERLLMLLPPSSIFARLIQFVCLDVGAQVGYPAAPHTLGSDLRTFGPTVLPGTPRMFSDLYEAALEPGGSVPDPVVHRRMRTALGGRVRYCVSTGAPLPHEVGLRFSGAGMPILEGYGRAETTAPVTVNTPGRRRPGTVGRPLPGVAVCVDGAGEILVAGGNVFRGYHGEDDRAGPDGGWFRTGDLGSVDDDGFLTLRGRASDGVDDHVDGRTEPSYS